MSSTETSVDKPEFFFFTIKKHCRIKHSPAKRIFDILFSLSVLVVGMPIYILLALLVKLTSKGPIFYRSPRVGRLGKVFSCWKFRSMHVDAEQKLKELLAAGGSLKKEWDQFHKLKNDPRITKVGRLLRKTSLDELPQFWNVLKGDLSVVGPRPYFPEEVQNFGIENLNIFSVRPGITGLWQTSGRNLLSFHERIALEQKYVDARSFKLDLILILKTIPLMFFSKDAF